MKRFEHKKTGWVAEFADITQGQLEEYFRLYRELKPEKASGTENCGAVVRAAVQAGWFDLNGPQSGLPLPHNPVDQMSPAFVRWLAGRIDEVYAEATTIPPE